MNRSIAVLIPCLNEELTIEQVVQDFREQLPDAAIYVYDNNSTDRTVERARAAGAIIGHEHRRGKGNVVRRMFRDVDADIYIMVDGDGTYPAESVKALMEPVLQERAQMSVGTRLETYEHGSFRALHKLGNRLIRTLINVLFRAKLRDILSGFRCFDGRYIKNIPLLSRGFEVETELTLQTLDKGYTVAEVPIQYQTRPSGSQSKLNTYQDGILLLTTILRIFKDYRPLKFFLSVGTVTLLLGLGLGSIPVFEFLETGKVLHFPTAILATGLVLTALLAFATGFILDTSNRREREQYHLLTILMAEIRKKNE